MRVCSCSTIMQVFCSNAGNETVSGSVSCCGLLASIPTPKALTPTGQVRLLGRARELSSTSSPPIVLTVDGGLRRERSRCLCQPSNFPRSRQSPPASRPGASGMPPGPAVQCIIVSLPESPQALSPRAPPLATGGGLASSTRIMHSALRTPPCSWLQWVSQTRRSDWRRATVACIAFLRQVEIEPKLMSDSHTEEGPVAVSSSTTTGRR